MNGYIYEGSGGGYYVYKIDGNYIYDSNGKHAYYIDGNYIYKGSGGGYYVYKIDGNYIYDSNGKHAYYIDGNYIYEGSGGGYPVYKIDGKMEKNERVTSGTGGLGNGGNLSGCLWKTLGIGLVLFVIVGMLIIAWPTFFKQLLNAEDAEQIFSQLFYLFLLILSHVISIVISVKNGEFSFKTVWLRTVQISIVCAGGGYWLFYTIFEGYTFGVLFSSLIMTGISSATTALIAVVITKAFQK